MSLYLALGIVLGIAIFLRFRYGSQVIPYAAASLLLVLFLFCPASFWPGIGGFGSGDQMTVQSQVDQLGEILGFALLVLAGWIAGGTRRLPPD